MTIVEMIAKRAQDLPAEKQQEVLDFAEFLRSRDREHRPLCSAEGLWSESESDMSADEIDTARRELWASFPRKDI